MSYTRGDEECSLWQIKSEDKQITNLGYDVVLSNVIMLETKIFVAVNKLYLTKKNLNPLLGQEIIRRYIIAHLLMF